MQTICTQNIENIKGEIEFTDKKTKKKYKIEAKLLLENLFKITGEFEFKLK